jgi:hypothetical protein
MLKDLFKNIIAFTSFNIAPYYLGKNWAKIKSNKIMPLTLHK